MMPQTPSDLAKVPALVVTDLSKRYVLRRASLWRKAEFKEVVKRVSLTIESGTTYALVGESGAGKSTVGRLLLRLIEPDSGGVVMDGRDVRDLDGGGLRRFRADTSMIFQDPYKSLDPKCTIRYSLNEPMLCQGLSERARKERVDELIDLVSLAPSFLNRYPYEMSGGQLQRVAIARALTNKPKFVVCDEPVAALDMSVRSQVVALLRSLQERLGLTYLFITHDLSLVSVIADRVGVMQAGTLVEDRSTRDLFDSPNSDYTRTLLSAIPARHPRFRSFRNPPLESGCGIAMPPDPGAAMPRAGLCRTPS